MRARERRRRRESEREIVSSIYKTVKCYHIDTSWRLVLVSDCISARDFTTDAELTTNSDYRYLLIRIERLLYLYYYTYAMCDHGVQQ